VLANHRNHRSEGLDELVGDVEGSEGLGRLAHARHTRERHACVRRSLEKGNVMDEG
jgi:hypothetical protein